MATIPK